ncbi:fatty-acid peroxygenase [Gracilibacillus halotolerans]|uniref:Fatty-acid peroxygenase n=1 Tax=Gracilibacillus halotolerans TaxID=74386 RepID=A0A841RMG4_9BACI|nr:cytochrome P450 [Gracilibacillus halotolerans]MBB6512124.1 fatty-acid peroxygenase [Gracilibacillus halotolerans]
MSNDNMPREEGFDHTLQLLKEGYHFILNRENRFQSRVFETTLLAEDAICLVGKKEAELFYDNDKFIRKGAAPKRLQKTLFGEGGVQGLDGIQHRQRKEMFLFLMNEESLMAVKTILRDEWKKEFTQSLKEINVYEAAKNVLARTALRWTGIPFERSEEWVEELSPMYEYASNVGIRHYQSRRARKKAEEWMFELIRDLRTGNLHADPKSAFHRFTWQRNAENELLDEEVVAVELLNLLRPITAVSVYVTFLILAVHEFPNEADLLRGEAKSDMLEPFVEEVRRYYPFFPFVVARVKNDFEWNGYTFPKDTLTLLDLYGTNHDPDIWSEPNRFNPERFMNWDKNLFAFIPQGGGQVDKGHRCPGEQMTVEILKTTLDFFVNDIRYTLPEQDLSYSMNDIPSLPVSNLLIHHVTFV